ARPNRIREPSPTSRAWSTNTTWPSPCTYRGSGGGTSSGSSAPTAWAAGTGTFRHSATTSADSPCPRGREPRSARTSRPQVEGGGVHRRRLVRRRSQDRDRADRRLLQPRLRAEGPARQGQRRLLVPARGPRHDLRPQRVDQGPPLTPTGREQPMTVQGVDYTEGWTGRATQALLDRGYRFA